MRLDSLLLLSAMCVVLLMPSLAWSQSEEEEEAREQLAEAKEQLAESDYDAALKAATTALRLYPSLYEAMMYKGLAYEGLGELKRAKSLLSTFKKVSYDDDAKAVAEEALERIQTALGEERQAAVVEGAAALSEASDDRDDDDDGDESAPVSSGLSKEPAVVSMAVPLDMPDYPAGSEEFLSWMIYRQQLSLLQSQRNVGLTMTIGGGALAGIGGGIAGVMAGLSQGGADDPNVYAGYGAGIGATISGVAILGAGLTLFVINSVKAKKLSSSRTSTAGVTPRLELDGGALALRF